MWVSRLHQHTELALTLQLYDLDRVVLLAHTEDFQVAKYRLLGFRVAINFYAEEVALVLPM